MATEIKFGLQQTGQSSTYCWLAPPDKSTGTMMGSPQLSQMYSASNSKLFPDLRCRFLFAEFQGCWIHTVSQSRWPRAVVEHVAKVRITSTTNHFSTYHTAGQVSFCCYVILLNGLIKTWPTGSRFKFGFGRKQWQAATNAQVTPFFLVVPIATCERLLSAFATSNFILARRQLLSPLSVRFYNLTATRFFLFNLWNARWLLREQTGTKKYCQQAQLRTFVIVKRIHFYWLHHFEWTETEVSPPIWIDRYRKYRLIVESIQKGQIVHDGWQFALRAFHQSLANSQTLATALN